MSIITLQPGQQVTIRAAADEPEPPPPPPPAANRKLIPAYVLWRDWTGVGNAPGDPGTYTDSVLALLGQTLQCKGLMVNGSGPLGLLGGIDWTHGVTPDEQAVISSQIVPRCRAHGLTKLYMGFGTAGPGNTAWLDWFDDVAWAALLIQLQQLAVAAKRMGFDGLFFGNEPGNWAWQYPGNTHNGLDTRAKANTRGAQVMDAILAGFGTTPAPEFVTYSTKFNGGYSQAIRPGTDFDATALYIDFNKGAAFTPGVTKFRFANADFYLGTSQAVMAQDVVGVEADLAAKWGSLPLGVQEVPFLWLGPSNGDGGGFYTADRISPQAGLAAAKAAYAVSPDEFYTFLYGPDPTVANWTAFTPSTPVTWTTPGNFEPAWRAGAGL